MYNTYRFGRIYTPLGGWRCIYKRVNGKLRKKSVSFTEALEKRIEGNVCSPKARKLDGVTYSKKELKQMLVW